MPPRPFPLALNIGTDICHTTRFEKYFIHHPAGKNSTLFRLFDKFLLPSEQRLFWKRFHLGEKAKGDAQKNVEQRRVGEEEGKMGGVMGEKRERITGAAAWNEEKRKACVNFVGGRWAAKEAIIKAYAPTRRLFLRDVEIRRNSSTREPYGIVLDTPLSSETQPSSAEAIYTQLLQEQTPTHLPTLPIEPHQNSPKILSENGILDLDAVQNALDPATPASTLTKKHAAHETGAQQAADRGMKKKSDEAEEEAIDLMDVKGAIVKVSISHDGEYCVATALAAL